MPTGQLRIDSPALFAAVGRALTSAAQLTASAVYSWVHQQPGSGEELPNRSKDTSFNPRAARVALIALSQSKATTTDEVVAALLVTVPDLSSCPEIWAGPVEIALAAQQLTIAQPLPAHIVALSHMIDTVRHLHLGPREQVTLRLANAQAILDIGRTIQPCQKLCTMLEQSISQQTILNDLRDDA